MKNSVFTYKRRKTSSQSASWKFWPGSRPNQCFGDVCNSNGPLRANLASCSYASDFGRKMRVRVFRVFQHKGGGKCEFAALQQGFSETAKADLRHNEPASVLFRDSPSGLRTFAAGNMKGCSAGLGRSRFRVGTQKVRCLGSLIESVLRVRIFLPPNQPLSDLADQSVSLTNSRYAGLTN